MSAVRSLRYKEAQTYYEEYQERLAILEDDSIKAVYFEPYTCPPYLLFFGDITKDPDNWVNLTMSSYYDKDLVMLIEK